jgi:hypothetical protein
MADPKSYNFAKPEDTDTVCRILKQIDDPKKLRVEISLEKKLTFGRDGERVYDKLTGEFSNYEGQSIPFTVILAHDGDNLFEGVEFDQWTLQESDEDGELGKFADSITQKLHNAYLKHYEDYKAGELSGTEYVFQSPVNKKELLTILKEAAKTADSNFKIRNKTPKGISGDFFSRNHGDLYIYFGAPIKNSKYTGVIFSQREIHDSCVNCEQSYSYPYLVKYVRSLVNAIGEVYKKSLIDESHKTTKKPTDKYGLGDGDRGDRGGGCEQA